MFRRSGVPAFRRGQGAPARDAGEVTAVFPGAARTTDGLPAPGARPWCGPCPARAGMPTVPVTVRVQAVGPICRSDLAIVAAPDTGRLLADRPLAHRIPSVLAPGLPDHCCFDPGAHTASSILAPERTRPLPFWPGGAQDHFRSGPVAHTHGSSALVCHRASTFWPWVPPGQNLYGRGCRKGSTFLAMGAIGLLRFWPWAPQGYYVSGAGCRKGRTAPGGSPGRRECRALARHDIPDISTFRTGARPIRSLTLGAKDRTMAGVSYLVVLGGGFGLPGRDAGPHWVGGRPEWRQLPCRSG